MCYTAKMQRAALGVEPKSGSCSGPLLDHEIRAALLTRLRHLFPLPTGSLVVDEFGCHGARVDVAVINCKLHGYEIKSERDTLARLSSQAPSYASIFDRVTVVVAPKHLAKVTDHIPAWWGITEASQRRGRVRFRCIRRGKANPSPDAHALVKLLWRREAYAVLRSHGLAAGLTNAPASTLRRALVEKLPLKTIADEVRAAIKARGGSGFDRQQTRCGDSCTTESTAGHYQTNLNWLLSVQSPGPQH